MTILGFAFLVGFVITILGRILFNAALGVLIAPYKLVVFAISFFKKN